MNSRRLIARRDPRLSAKITSSFPLRVSARTFVRAGSALVRVGNRLLVIQDDAWQAWWIEPRRRALQPLLLKGSGRRKPKRKKPDFETAFALADGRIWVLGSGSTPRRRRIALIQPGRRECVSVHDAAPLYRALESALGMPPNIEGAVPMQGRLRLFHRGPGRARQANAMLEVPLDALTGAVPRVLLVRQCDLGTVAGLNFGFTDAVALDARRILYLAAAENTPDGIADGAVAGAALGVLERNSASWTPLLEADGRRSVRKIEGVALSPGRRGGYLLTDPDDPARAAELVSFSLTGLRP